MIVVDASAAVAALLTDGAARHALATERLHAPHLVDAEVAHVLRRQVAGGRIDPDVALRQLETWQALGVTRYPMTGLLTRVWELRDNASAYDACYLALAESIDCPLVTMDGRLSRAPGLRCAVTVLPG